MTANSGDSWQEAYRHGVLLILPPPPIREFFNALRRKYDPKSDAIAEAHISITPPLRNALVPESRKQLGAIIEQFHRISVTLGPLKTFLPYPCVYCDVAPASPLNALRERLQETGLFHAPGEHPFVPHLTVTEFGTKGEEDTLQVLHELEAIAMPSGFEVVGLAHMIPNAHFRFERAGDFFFGSSQGAAQS